MNVRSETSKILGKKIGSNFFDISLSNNFFFFFLFDLSPQRKQQKQKYKWDLHQTKNLLHSKGNYQQNKKETYGMQWNTYKKYTQQEEQGSLAGCSPWGRKESDTT